jgi:hypothetical protein
MFVLADNDKLTLRVVSGGPVTWYCGTIDHGVTARKRDTATGKAALGEPTTMAEGAPGSDRRVVSIVVAVVKADAEVSVMLNDAVLAQVTVTTLETLYYQTGEGWKILT